MDMVYTIVRRQMKTKFKLSFALFNLFLITYFIHNFFTKFPHFVHCFWRIKLQCIFNMFFCTDENMLLG